MRSSCVLISLMLVPAGFSPAGAEPAEKLVQKAVKSRPAVPENAIIRLVRVIHNFF